MTVQQKELVPGLAGIPAAESAVSYIDGQVGLIEYRGIRLETLAEKSTFEEVAWLLMKGSLPTPAELTRFCERLAAARSLAGEVASAIRAMPKGGHPMHALQAGFALLGMSAEGGYATDEERDEHWIRILGAAPTLVAFFDRARRGLDPVEPCGDMGTSGDFLWMINGERPDELAERILDVALILHAEHTMNASTFAARVVASTEADPYSVCSAATGALHGPLHGGANERVLEQLESIGSADAVADWVAKQMAERSKIMGFGHRVYKVKDPRATIIQGLVRQLFEKLGRTPIYDIAVKLEDAVVGKLGDKGIHPNVDFYSGIVYQKLGIATDLFTPVFAIARTSGWLAHWAEQMRDNKIFRPGQIYVGAHGAQYTDPDGR